ncbi:MAG: 3-phosphoshikimate 1-carboxyvinyltransferase [Bacteroidetes bacterium]|nr:3-phosphoshikimate 1-carboxyvinyltransferase [Bacteroidota bacterium]
MLHSGSHIARVRPASSVIGIVDVPSDKSIAHRAAIFSALAEGASRLVDYPTSDDPQSTLSCIKQLGVEVYEEDEILVIEGKGLHGLTSSGADLYCGNSGTTMRLLSGMLAGQSFSTTLSGDASLARRDMSRIRDPLNAMGASIELVENHSPIRIAGGRALTGLHYELPVASAQVKSAVLLAGLYAEGESSVTEFARSRDHTERMLGLDIVEFADRRVITIKGGMDIKARTWSIPRDFSAAAYFIVAALVLPDSALRIPRVGLNPTRAGLLDVLIAMGARIYIENERVVGGEAVGDLVVVCCQHAGIVIWGDTQTTPQQERPKHARPPP